MPSYSAVVQILEKGVLSCSSDISWCLIVGSNCVQNLTIKSGFYLQKYDKYLYQLFTKCPVQDRIKMFVEAIMMKADQSTCSDR